MMAHLWLVFLAAPLWQQALMVAAVAGAVWVAAGIAVGAICLVAAVGLALYAAVATIMERGRHRRWRRKVSREMQAFAERLGTHVPRVRDTSRSWR